jgi:hypothetical protein
MWFLQLPERGSFPVQQTAQLCGAEREIPGHRGGVRQQGTVDGAFQDRRDAVGDPQIG